MEAQADTAHHHLFITSVAENKLSDMAAHIDDLERDGYRVLATAGLIDDRVLVTMFRP